MLRENFAAVPPELFSAEQLAAMEYAASMVTVIRQSTRFTDSLGLIDGRTDINQVIELDNISMQANWARWDYESDDGASTLAYDPAMPFEYGQLQVSLAADLMLYPDTPRGSYPDIFERFYVYRCAITLTDLQFSTYYKKCES